MAGNKRKRGSEEESPAPTKPKHQAVPRYERKERKRSAQQHEPPLQEEPKVKKGKPKVDKGKPKVKRQKEPRTASKPSATKDSIHPSEGADVTLMTLPLEVRLRIWYYCLQDVSAQKNEVQILRVSSQIYGECAMLPYDNLSVIISGRDFEFDQVLGEQKYCDPQGHLYSEDRVRNGKTTQERCHAKLSLLLGKSKYGPDYGSLCAYSKTLHIVIDGLQYEDDSIFIGNRTRQPFPNPEHKRLLDRDEDVSPEAAGMCQDRKQGRVSINAILMGNLCRFLRNSRPDLESISIDIGFGIKTLKWQKANFPLKKAYTPVGNERVFHILESLAPLMTLSCIKPLEVGLALRSHLRDLSESNYKRKYVLWSHETNAFEPIPDNDDDFIDYKDIPNAIYNQAQNLATRYQDRDIGQVGTTIDNFLQSFLPYPIAPTDTASCQINRLYEFDPWVYDDLRAIQYLVKHQPCLATIQVFYSRIINETLRRLGPLREAEAKFATNQDLASLEEFFLAFRTRNPEVLLKPQSRHGVQLDLGAGVFDRAIQMRKLKKHGAKNTSSVTADNEIFKSIQNELEQHLDRIEQQFTSLTKYFFVGKYVPPVLKKVKPPPLAMPTPETEWTPETQLKKLQEEDDELERMKISRTTKLDAEIRNAIAKRDPQTAWLRLKVLQLSGSFCPDLFSSRPPATIPIPRFKVATDTRSQEEIEAELLADAKKLCAEELAKDRDYGSPSTRANGPKKGQKHAETLSRAKVTVHAKHAAKQASKAARLVEDERLREAHRQELIDAGYGVREEEGST